MVSGIVLSPMASEDVATELVIAPIDMVEIVILLGVSGIPNVLADPHSDIL